MAFKDFFKRNLDNVLVCTTLLLPPIMMGGPFVADAYHSHQYNKDPVRYQKRAIEERIKGLEKAKDSDNIEDIKAKTLELSNVIQKAGAEMYKNAKPEEKPEQKKEKPKEEGGTQEGEYKEK